MFDEPDIDDLKVRPELDEDETVERVTTGTLGDVLRDNAVILITDRRLISGEKRGRSVDEEFQDQVGFDIELHEIDTVRRHGIVTKSIEVVAGEVVYELPPIQNTSDEVITALVQHVPLEKTEWGEEGAAVSGTKKLIGGGIGILALITGGIFAILGIAGIISLAGILIGIPFLLGGLLVAYIGWKIVEWAFDKQEEWVRKTVEATN